MNEHWVGDNAIGQGVAKKRGRGDRTRIVSRARLGRAP